MQDKTLELNETSQSLKTYIENHRLYQSRRPTPFHSLLQYERYISQNEEIVRKRPAIYPDKKSPNVFLIKNFPHPDNFDSAKLTLTKFGHPQLHYYEEGSEDKGETIPIQSNNDFERLFVKSNPSSPSKDMFTWYWGLMSEFPNPLTWPILGIGVAFGLIGVGLIAGPVRLLKFLANKLHPALFALSLLVLIPLTLCSWAVGVTVGFPPILPVAFAASGVEIATRILVSVVVLPAIGIVKGLEKLSNRITQWFRGVKNPTEQPEDPKASTEVADEKTRLISGIQNNDTTNISNNDDLANDTNSLDTSFGDKEVSPCYPNPIGCYSRQSATVPQITPYRIDIIDNEEVVDSSQTPSNTTRI